MASGGWGYTPNPFAAAPAQPAQPSPERPAANTGFGAWGAALGAAPPSAAPPPPPPPPGAFSIETSGGGAGVSLSQREADLARREAELARKEAAILNAADAARPKNFPPFCSIVYHNIAEQIPAWNRSMIRFHFFTELLVILGFVWNAAVQLAAMFSGVLTLTWWLISLLALVMGVPLSWWLYYKSLFRASRTDGALCAYLTAAACILLNIAWCVWMVLGVNGLGDFSGGIFPLLRMFQAGDGKGTTFGILYVINTVIWGVSGIGGWLSLGLSVAAMRRGSKPRLDYESRFGAGAPLPSV